MNTEDYEKACLDTLTNNEHYEEIPVDLNPSYKEEVQEVADELLNNHLINESGVNQVGVWTGTGLGR